MVLFKRISFSCCTFASNILDVLRNCMLIIPSSTEDSQSKKNVQKSIRLQSILRSIGLSSDHICYFIHLGSILDENLIQPRLNVACNSVPESGDDESQNGTKLLFPNLDSSHAYLNEFEQWERNLWCVYVQDIVIFMCFKILDSHTNYF